MPETRVSELPTRHRNPATTQLNLLRRLAAATTVLPIPRQLDPTHQSFLVTPPTPRRECAHGTREESDGDKATHRAEEGLRCR